jgi:DNA-directed RNA polymerase subunit RPC12/RpoP
MSITASGRKEESMTKKKIAEDTPIELVAEPKEYKGWKCPACGAVNDVTSRDNLVECPNCLERLWPPDRS